MTVRQQWMVVAGIVAFLALLLGAGTYLMHDQLFPVEVGSTAPDFEGRTVNGTNQVRSMADYKGKVVVLNVWATWCEPCKVEMPSIELLHRVFSKTDLQVVAVSIDDVVGADSVRRYADNFALTFDILLDSLHRIDRDYQVTGYPETFVIARDGTIRKKWIGPANWVSHDNVALIRDLLGLADSTQVRVQPESAAQVQLNR
jgi:cytochrome c biogenesis protein CcmG/thiol:disulfide interchange protein DsbE